MPLFAACAFSAACPGPKNNNNNNQPSPTPSASQTPTPSPSASPDLLFRENGERPIIISGGSVDIDFNHDDGFWEESDGVFKCTGCRITEYLIFNQDEKLTNTPVVNRLATTGVISEIVLEAVHETDPRPITIKADGEGNVLLDFDTSVAYPIRPSSERRHFQKRARINRVTINGSEMACNEGGIGASCGKFLKNKYSILIRVRK